jgi:hypothetical protein
MSIMTATHHRSQLMRNFGIREADLTSLEITITEEINPSAINTKWETAIAKVVLSVETAPWRRALRIDRLRLRTSEVIKTTLARDRLLRTMEICGHIPRWEPPVIQAAPAPTPPIQPPQAAPAPPAAPAPTPVIQPPQAAPAPQEAPAPQAAPASPAAPARPRQPVIYVRNPLTGRRILKSGRLYKKLQREGKIPNDPQTYEQRRRHEDELARVARRRRDISALVEQHLEGRDVQLQRVANAVFHNVASEEQQRQHMVVERQRVEAEAPEQSRLRVEAAAAGALARLEAQRTAAREQRPTEQPTEPCAICMDDTYTDPLRLRECGHTYCYECIKHWHTSRHGRAKCPTCRTDIQRNPALA